MILYLNVLFFICNLLLLIFLIEEKKKVKNKINLSSIYVKVQEKYISNNIGEISIKGTVPKGAKVYLYCDNKREKMSVSNGQFKFHYLMKAEEVYINVKVFSGTEKLEKKVLLVSSTNYVKDLKLKKESKKCLLDFDTIWDQHWRIIWSESCIEREALAHIKKAIQLYEELFNYLESPVFKTTYASNQFVINMRQSIKWRMTGLNFSKEQIMVQELNNPLVIKKLKLILDKGDYELKKAIKNGAIYQ